MLTAIRNVVTGFTVTATVVILSIIIPEQLSNDRSDLPVPLQKIIETRQDEFSTEKVYRPSVKDTKPPYDPRQKYKAPPVAEDHDKEDQIYKPKVIPVTGLRKQTSNNKIYLLLGALVGILIGLFLVYKKYGTIIPAGLSTSLTRSATKSEISLEPQAERIAPPPVEPVVAYELQGEPLPQASRSVDLEELQVPVETIALRKQVPWLPIATASFAEKEEQLLASTIMNVRVQGPNNLVIEKGYPSNLSFAALKDQLLQEAGIENNREDFGLCTIDGKVTDWIDEMQIISDAQDLLKSTVLYLKSKPKPLQIQYLSEVKTLYLEEDITIESVIDRLFQVFSVTRERAAEYDLVKLPNDEVNKYVMNAETIETVTFLDPQKKLSDYAFSKMEKLYLINRLRRIRLKFWDGTMIELFVDFSILIADLFDIIETTIWPIAEDYNIYMNKSGIQQPLSDFLTLREHNVKEGSLLTLKRIEPEEQLKEPSVWEEQTNNKTILLNDDGTLRAGTLNQIVNYMTSNYKDSNTVMKVVIDLHSCFTTSAALFEKLLLRYQVPPNFDAKTKVRTQTSVSAAFQYWKTTNHHTFTDKQKEMFDLVDVIDMEDKMVLNPKKLDAIDLSKLKRPDSGQINVIKELRRTQSWKSEKMKQALEQAEQEDKIKRDSVILNSAMPNQQKRKGSLLDIFSAKTKSMDDRVEFFDKNAKEIAQQLTLKCHRIYSAIQKVELFKQSWNKTPQLSPNVSAMAKLFNEVSRMVSSAIVLESELKGRVSLVHAMIKIAKNLRQLNNFHLLMAFIGAFNNYAVGRLQWTMKEISFFSRRSLTDLEKLMSTASSFKMYRLALQTAKTSCIPFMGLALQDLTFADENPEKIESLINMEKHKMIHQIITDALKFQKIPYSDLNYMPDMANFLDRLPSLSDDQLYERSVLIEPKNASKLDIK